MQRDSVDWFLFAFTAAATLGTLLAVAVALFGPQLQRRWNRPRLTLTLASQDELVFSGKETTVSLLLHNQPGTDRADSVEAFLSVVEHRPADEVWMPDDWDLLVQENLDFGHGETVSSVAAGFSRRFALVRLSSLEMRPPIRRMGEEELSCGTFATPQAQAELAWSPDATWLLAIAVTGSNFDAVTYRGAFQVKKTDGGGVLTLVWTEPLVTSPSATRPRRAPATTRG